MAVAAETLEVQFNIPAAPRASVRRVMLGALARVPARHEVLVIDRTTRKLVIRIPVDGPEPEAKALAALLEHELQHMDETTFLKRHGRAHRHR